MPLRAKIGLLCLFSVMSLWGAAACDTQLNGSSRNTYEPTTVPEHADVGTTLTCVRISTSYDLDRLRERGFNPQYSDGSWWLNSERVGEAKAGDEAFDLCTTQRI